MNSEHPAARDFTAKKGQESFAREQTRLNQIQEAEQMREWVSREDDFVLQQSKKKAQIRVKEGRAKSIDWLAVTLGVIDTTRDPLREDETGADLDVVDPAGVFEDLTTTQLQALGKDIDTYMVLESSLSNRRYWKVGRSPLLNNLFTNLYQALKVICEDYQARLSPTPNQARSTQSVSADVDRLLSPKSLKELEVLEQQISGKLQSNEPIDVEYWEQLLRSVAVYKSRAELNAVYKTIIQSRLNNLREEQRAEAVNAKEKLALLLSNSSSSNEPASQTPSSASLPLSTQGLALQYSRRLDPEPLLKLRTEDKTLDVTEEKEFMDKIVSSLDPRVVS